MMIDVSIEKILYHLKSVKYDAQLQKETGQIFIIFKIHQAEFPLFIRHIEESKLLQILTFFPSNIKTKHIGDVARFLHFLNKELDIPGFGMDESSSVSFYRIVLPLSNNKIDTNTLDAFLSSIQKICETFFPAIAAISQGASTYEELLQKMRRMAEI